MPILTVTGSGSELQGVARLEDGRAVFVPGALPGEEVEIELGAMKDRFALGRLKRVLEPSPERAQPDCPNYGRCGGCRARHMTYREELRLKREKVFSALVHLGGLNAPEVADTLPSPLRCAYRNKTEFACAGGRVGVMEEGGGEVVDVESCLLQSEAMNRLLGLVKPRLGGVPARYLVLRESSSGEMMLTFSLTRACDVTPLARELMRAEPALKSVYSCLLEARPAHALDGVCRLAEGAKTLCETLCGLRFQISPRSFFQVNRQQAERMYALALDMADLGPGARLADVYCGAGTISLAAASRGASVTGIEIVEDAVRDARANARANGLIDRADFICGDAAREYPQLSRRQPFDAVVADPPRKGLARPVVDALIAAPPRRLVYVSCDPATLARDVKLLTASGVYRFDKAVPVDMFPGTHHVESVVKLTRAGL